MNKRESVSVIAFRNDRCEVLLTQRRDIPVWVLPGGGIEEGESPEDAACRECYEETGFHVAVLRKVAVYEPRNRLTHRTHFFECRILHGKATRGSESLAVQFFPVNQPPPMPPPYLSWIQDALKDTREVIHKHIDDVNYTTLCKLFFLHPVLVFRFLLTRIGIHINTKDHEDGS